MTIIIFGCELALKNLPPNPSGPSGIGSGAIESDTSRSLDFSASGGLFLTGFSSSNTSSTGTCIISMS